ncbi:MAG: DUF1559 domain-containing protein [Gemmataceae bacterium]|nr:DUF1559 domain-containing protein [Gemmataceae bacterium]
MEVRFDPSNAKFAGSAAMVMYGVVMPAAQRVQMAAGASEGQNNLKQLALAMHNYASAYNHFPTAIFSKDGKKPLLSWRVALLPYMEQDALYKQFKLDEPWDSDANKPLLAKMPKVFADLDAPPSKEPGMTHYQVFVGGGAAFRMSKEGTRLFDITDGLSNTVMIVTATDPIAWTKPGDLPYSANKPVPKLGFGGGKKINVAMCDGSVRQIPANATVTALRALITMAGGELISDDY